MLASEGWSAANTQRFLNWTYRLWTIRLFEARRQYQGVRWTDDTMGAGMPDQWGGPISGSLVRRIRRQGLDGYRWRPGGRPKKVMGWLGGRIAHKPAVAHLFSPVAEIKQCLTNRAATYWTD